MSGKIMWRYILYFALSLFFAQRVTAAEVTVAVAANFSAPAKAIVLRFEEQTGHHVKLVLGSSGRIFAQIMHGAPFDVFLSADALKPAALKARGMTVPNSHFTYAIGALALWSADPGFIDNTGDILKEGRFNKLALANPRLAPYGLAARQVLQSLGLYETLSAKFVRGENIAQTYQFIATANADLGFIARAQLPATGSYWIIPESLYQPIRQDAVILKSAADNKAALTFTRFLASDWAKKMISRHGYKIPNGDQ